MADFSCYITVKNKSSYNFSKDSEHVEWGGWKKQPPSTIEKNTTADFQLEDHAGPAGSEGWVKYAAFDRVKFRFAFDCPYGSGDNKGTLDCSAASSSTHPCPKYISSMRGKSGDGDWQDGTVPTDGHPLHVEWTIKDA